MCTDYDYDYDDDNDNDWYEDGEEQEGYTNGNAAAAAGGWSNIDV